jgi:hypothetical protein
MTDQVTEIVKAEAVEIVDVAIDDVESGGMTVEEEDADPNNKTCYTPILKQANDLYEHKIHPALLPIQEKVYPLYKDKVVPVMNKVGDFFDDDVEDPIGTEETTDEDGNIVHRDATLFKVSPACFGAAVLGFGVTTIVIGPFIAVAAGAGAAYATSRQGKAGEYSNFYGKKTYNGLSRGYRNSKNAINALKGRFVKDTVDNDNTAATAAGAGSLEAA